METGLTLELKKVGPGFNTYHVISQFCHNSSLVWFPRLEVPLQANWGGGLQWCEDCSKNVEKLKKYYDDKKTAPAKSEKV